jgi:RNA polymerase sigma-70 factor (ECF subfamily)
MIQEGRGLVLTALTGGPPGLYGVQAAIAALHDEAADLATSDWPQIVALYDLLHRLGRLPEAAAAYREALDLDGTEPERAHLRRRLKRPYRPDRTVRPTDDGQTPRCRHRLHGSRPPAAPPG